MPVPLSVAMQQRDDREKALIAGDGPVQGAEEEAVDESAMADAVEDALDETMDTTDAPAEEELDHVPMPVQADASIAESTGMNAEDM